MSKKEDGHGFEANLEEKESWEVYLEVIKEHAAVEIVTVPNKQYRGRNLAVKPRRRPKDRSRWKSAANHRGTTRQAKVARRKGNVGKSQMREKAGRRISKRRTS